MGPFGLGACRRRYQHYRRTASFDRAFGDDTRNHACDGTCVPPIGAWCERSHRRVTSGMSKVVIYTDGGARGNPGPAGAGVVIFDGETKLAEVKQYLGEKQTNNWAEYEAVTIALS